MGKQIFFLGMLLLCNLLAQSQEVTLAEEMRSNGKIYVVVAVIVTIFAGIIFYLIRLDGKISRLEKNKP